jgi:hypothetical protein
MTGANPSTSSGQASGPLLLSGDALGGAPTEPPSGCRRYHLFPTEAPVLPALMPTFAFSPLGAGPRVE